MTTLLAAEVARQFYDAFSRHDAEGMAALYHPQATFSDLVFGTLNAAQTQAMWRMLVGRAPEMRVSFEPQPAGGQDPQAARGRWDAHYPFSQTGRQVHNIVFTEVTARDGLIFRHTDHFDFWRWSRQALGLPGVLLGWTPALHGRVSKTALAGLEAYMAKGK